MGLSRSRRRTGRRSRSQEGDVSLEHGPSKLEKKLGSCAKKLEKLGPIGVASTEPPKVTTLVGYRTVDTCYSPTPRLVQLYQSVFLSVISLRLEGLGLRMSISKALDEGCKHTEQQVSTFGELRCEFVETGNEREPSSNSTKNKNRDSWLLFKGDGSFSYVGNCGMIAI